MSVKLEVGKYYRSRDGEKWFVGMRVEKFRRCDAEFWGHNEHGIVRSWASDGRFVFERDANQDLVAEWREPRSITVDVYLLKCNDDSLAWLTVRANSVPCFSGDKIAGVKRGVTITEGDGMEEKQCSANS